MYTALIGLPFARESSAAEPAVEPKSTLLPWRKFSALLEPAEYTHLIETPGKACSTQPCCLSTSDGGGCGGRDRWACRGLRPGTAAGGEHDGECGEDGDGGALHFSTPICVLFLEIERPPIFGGLCAVLVRRYAGATSNDTKAPWAWGPSRTSIHRRNES